MREIVTVIIPVYNVEKYIEECIDSVCRQSYDSLEIILVDDGSTDNSGSLCDLYAERDSRIKVIHKNNGGLSDARNVGIKSATGKYLIFIDSDDYIAPDFVKVLLERLLDDLSDIALTNIQLVDSQGNLLDTNWNIKDSLLDEMGFWNEMYRNIRTPYVVAWNKIYKRELFENVSYPKGKLHEDEYIIHHIIKQCNKVSVCSDRLYYYRQHKDSIMGQKYSKKRLDIFPAMEERIKYFFDEGMQELVWITLGNMRGEVCKAYKNLNMINDENNDSYIIARKSFIKCFKICCKSKLNKTEFVKALGLLCNIKLYIYLAERYA